MSQISSVIVWKGESWINSPKTPAIWVQLKCVSETQTQLMIWQTRPTTVSLEIHSHYFPVRSLDADTQTIIVYVYISRGPNKWKAEISSTCFDFGIYNRDPGKPQRSFPSFVDKLPNQFPVFGSLLDMSFSRTACTATALTSFSYGSFYMWRNRGGKFAELIRTQTLHRILSKQN